MRRSRVPACAGQIHARCSGGGFVLGVATSSSFELIFKFFPFAYLLIIGSYHFLLFKGQTRLLKYIVMMLLPPRSALNAPPTAVYSNLL